MPLRGNPSEEKGLKGASGLSTLQGMLRKMAFEAYDTKH